MITAEQVKHELDSYINPEKAAFFPNFFKTGPGDYGEGDKFLGIVVPDQRKVAKKYAPEIPLEEVAQLLASEFHEYRLTGLYILTYKAKSQRTSEKSKDEIHDFYLAHINSVNNWDLVDASAVEIIGEHAIRHTDDSTIIRLSESGQLWRQRISVIATFAHIRRDRFDLTLRLCEQFLEHDHDLMHKATGWVLRDVGKRDLSVLKGFLDTHAEKMPRTMLRYAIEKLSDQQRAYYLGQKKAK